MNKTMIKQLCIVSGMCKLETVIVKFCSLNSRHETVIVVSEFRDIVLRVWN